MCITEIRVGRYAHELDSEMYAQIVWNSSTWEIFLPSGFFVCFFFKDVFYLFERERREKHEREGQREREKQVPCWTGSLPWDLDHDLSLRQKLNRLSHTDATFSFFFFLIINLLFIGVQFAHIQNNTQCSARQYPSWIHPTPALLPFHHP